MTIRQTRVGASVRQSEVLRLLKQKDTWTISELAAALSVSDETVRRSIKPLVNEGLVDKVHGAVMMPDKQREPPFQRRMQKNAEAKQLIAATMAKLVPDGASLMLDTGSTTAYVAQALCDHHDLTVVTNSAEIARTLATRNGNRVFMAGGELRADDAAAFGPAALQFIAQFEVDHAILSMAGIDETLGFSDYHLTEAEFSRAVIGRARETTIVADTSKFGIRALVKVCGPDSVDRIVTDCPPAPGYVRMILAAGIDLVVADSTISNAAQG